MVSGLARGVVGVLADVVYQATGVAGLGRRGVGVRMARNESRPKRASWVHVCVSGVHGCVCACVGDLVSACAFVCVWRPKRASWVHVCVCVCQACMGVCVRAWVI